jgi:hypothetical protein
MLSQSSSTSHEAYANSIRMQNTEAVWSAIASVLRRLNIATTREIADAIDRSPSATQMRLNELRELGEVRFATVRRSTKVRAWTLGAEDHIARAEQMTPTITKATQLGIFQRDPLVAALFGAGKARCVSCEQPEGTPHADDCAFVGLNIDAIHQRALS